MSLHPRSGTYWQAFGNGTRFVLARGFTTLGTVLVSTQGRFGRWNVRQHEADPADLFLTRDAALTRHRSQRGRRRGVSPADAAA